MRKHISGEHFVHALVRRNDRFVVLSEESVFSEVSSVELIDFSPYDLVINCVCDYAKNGYLFPAIEANLSLGVVLLEKIVNLGGGISLLNVTTMLPFRQNLYSRTKRAFDTVANLYVNNFEALNVVNLRIGNVYGYDIRGDDLISQFLRAIKSNQSSFLVKNPNALLNLIHIDDVVQLVGILISRLDKLSGYSSFYVQTNSFFTVNDILLLIKSILHSNIILSFNDEHNSVVEDFPSSFFKYEEDGILLDNNDFKFRDFQLTLSSWLQTVL